ncbi:MAG: acid protease [Bacteroidetes bacterium]|nr:MAG: acid protease [Bacteroidota bacterium]TDI77533.1 MAG: acid protease [Bacteroidota bacterium]
MDTKLPICCLSLQKNVASLRKLLEGQNFERIPLQKLNTGHYQLSLKINNKHGDFILDTGASTSCIGFESVSYFILNTKESEIKAAGAGATDMETKIAVNNLLEIGGVKLIDQDIIIFDLSHINSALHQVDENEIHGILGADLLKRLRAVIDYGRNCLYIR